MGDIASALTEIATCVDTVSGIRAVTDDPPESISHFPFATVYTTGAEYKLFPVGQLTEIHTIRVDLIVSRIDTARQIAKLVGLARAIPNAIGKKQRSTSPFTGFITTGDTITCTLITTNWGGTDVLIYRYEFTVKVQGVYT